MLAASDVDAHPGGASLFGVMDMVGNVWQWTDEYTDEHTRAAILRGGNHYRPLGSVWYFPPFNYPQFGVESGWLLMDRILSQVRYLRSVEDTWLSDCHEESAACSRVERPGVFGGFPDG
jgi:hypothetical protein